MTETDYFPKGGVPGNFQKKSPIKYQNLSLADP